MFRWLKRILSPPDLFEIPGKSVIPSCRFRPYTTSDRDACVEIYRLNEAARFPPGYLDHFAGWLADGRDLVLVCEVDGVVRGLGGVSLSQQPSLERAHLNFGMVHPSHQRRGLGTALLLARLATLPRPEGTWIALLSTTGGSESFYQRFGFLFVRHFVDERQNTFREYRASVSAPEWQACRDALAAAPALLDMADAVVPVIRHLKDAQS